MLPHSRLCWSAQLSCKRSTALDFRRCKPAGAADSIAARLRCGEGWLTRAFWWTRRRQHRCTIMAAWDWKAARTAAKEETRGRMPPACTADFGLRACCEAPLNARLGPQKAEAGNLCCWQLANERATQHTQHCKWPAGLAATAMKQCKQFAQPVQLQRSGKQGCHRLRQHTEL